MEATVNEARQIFAFSPQDLGLPPKFQEFRIPQAQAISDFLGAGKRFGCPAIDTGGGKSAYYFAIAMLLDARMAVLTSSKGLQAQLLGDFRSMGLTDVRGRNNFPCSVFSHETCEVGAKSGCGIRRAETCPYWSQYQDALRSKLFVTNYDYWTSVHQYGEGLGKFDLLVCDEAHDAPDKVCSGAGVELTAEEIYRRLRTDWPALISDHESYETGPERNRQRGQEMAQWTEWATPLASYAEAEVTAMESALDEGTLDPTPENWRMFSEFRILFNKLDRIVTHTDEWAWEPTMGPTGTGYRLEPLQAAAYAEAVLFRNIPHVLLVSASLMPKTLSMLGISEQDRDYREYPATFPRNRRPVVYIQGAPRLNRFTSQEALIRWIDLIDSIIGPRLDRKGIIHTVSYDRAMYIYSHSRYRSSMMSPATRTTGDVVERFKSSRPGTILISPAVNTGYDFKYHLCEYQIIAKMPYPSLGAGIVQARQDLDDEYQYYILTQNLVQSCGRGMRAHDDRCENFIVDGGIGQIMRFYRHLMPSWFRNLYRTESKVPPPPPPLPEIPEGSPLNTNSNEEK